MAMERLGHHCVMASEIDPELVDLYERNHGMRPLGDLRGIDPVDVPAHDVLCAGFPCQPFSKAGFQHGRACPAWGDLFDHVLAILRTRRPTYLILENVPNLLRHRGGATWSEMREELEALGYDVDARLQSPHMFGVPQARDRAIIVGALGQDSLDPAPDGWRLLVGSSDLERSGRWLGRDGDGSSPRPSSARRWSGCA